MTFSIRNNTIRIEKSKTHGSGVFSNAHFETGDFLGTVLKRVAHTGKPDEDYFRTAMGRYINHSKDPNTTIVSMETNRYGLTATRDIKKGEELFINYEIMAKITGIPFQPFSKQAGLFQPPPMMVDKIWEWVLPRYASIVYQTTKDIKLKEEAGKDCDFQPLEYQDIETTVPLSLEGWKYYDEDFQTALEEWKEMWSDIKVKISSTYEPEFVGRYNDTDNVIDIVFDRQWFNPSYNNYEMLKKSIHRNIEHEVIHLGQYIFKHFKNLQNIGGLPSKRIRDTEYTPEGQYDVTSVNPETGETYYSEAEKFYALRDIEFNALINDAKIALRRQLEKWPDDMHYHIFNRYVGIPSKMPVTEMSVTQEFFAQLRKLEPAKWKKAVKELYNALSSTFPNIFKRKEANMFISKRAREKTTYEVKLQPTENQLEYFFGKEGVKYHPLEERPNPHGMTEDYQDSYFDGLENAFQFALKEFKDLADKLGFKITNDSLDYSTSNEKIFPAHLRIEADPYTVNQIKTHPVIRGVEEVSSTFNEVYV